MRTRAASAALLVAGLATPVPLAGQDPAPRPSSVADEIRLHLEQLREAGGLELPALEISQEGLFGLYEPHDFEPLWTPTAARDLGRFVARLDIDGLDPVDYGVGVLDSLARTPVATARDAAVREVVLSEVLLRVAHDLRRGAVDPARLGPDWADTPREAALPVDSIRRMVVAGGLARSLARLRPDHFIYQGLVNALARYRAIESRGGWHPVGDGPLLGRDSVSARVPALRRRLLRTGDLPPGADTTSMAFDAPLEDAVRRFQHRHGLNEDGVVGDGTRAALDVPVAERILQLRLNLERARWVAPGLRDEYVTVNIAGQRIYLIRDGGVIWESRVVVGQPYTSTPVFRDQMRYLVVNPTWTVPRSINDEILARLRREPDYLATAGFDVLDAAGNTVDPGGIDFAAYTGNGFPWVFRQRPGPTNSLGRIKFMFPNRHNVYLHDSPARSLFAREQRTFSHGCIRVEDPMELAALLLEPQGGPDRESLAAMAATGDTRTVTLDTPLPVLLLYWTASTDLHGEVHFYRDVYDRDPTLRRALLGDGG